MPLGLRRVERRAAPVAALVAATVFAVLLVAPSPSQAATDVSYLPVPVAERSLLRPAAVGSVTGLAGWRVVDRPMTVTTFELLTDPVQGSFEPVASAVAFGRSAAAAGSRQALPVGWTQLVVTQTGTSTAARMLLRQMKVSASYQPASVVSSSSKHLATRYTYRESGRVYVLARHQLLGTRFVVSAVCQTTKAPTGQVTGPGLRASQREASVCAQRLAAAQRTATAAKYSRFGRPSRPQAPSQ